MIDTNALIVFFSRTGTTRDVAKEIRRALEQRGVRCNVEALYERRSRRGIVGYLRSGFDAARDRPAELLPLTHDPSRYDIVVVGTPVWSASPSTPVRAFLRANAIHLRQVAFFLTHGGSGLERTLSQMRLLATKAPIAELALREGEIARGREQSAIREFAETIACELTAPSQAAASRAP